MKQDPPASAIAVLLMLCMLMLSLAPTVAAMNVRDGAMSARRDRMRPRYALRVENGIVTDDDGIIGNSATGADHAPHGRHPMPRLLPTAGMGERVAQGAERIMNGVDKATDRMRGRDVTPNAPDSDVHTEDGMIEDGNAQNGIVEHEQNAENGLLPNDGIAPDDVAPHDVAPGDGEGVAEDETASARSALPWVIVIIIVLAAVLVVLALMPGRKKRR